MQKEYFSSRFKIINDTFKTYFENYRFDKQSILIAHKYFFYLKNSYGSNFMYNTLFNVKFHEPDYRKMFNQNYTIKGAKGIIIDLFSKEENILTLNNILYIIYNCKITIYMYNTTYIFTNIIKFFEYINTLSSSSNSNLFKINILYNKTEDNYSIVINDNHKYIIKILLIDI